MSSRLHSSRKRQHQHNARPESPDSGSPPESSNSLASRQPSRLELVQRAIMAPFNHKKADSTRILSDLAPVIMTPRMIHSAATASSRSRGSVSDDQYYKASSSESSSSLVRSKFDFATIGRTHTRFGFSGSRPITSVDLQIVEATEELLAVDVPEVEGVAENVSLLKGFNATIPSADSSRVRRRQMRNVVTPKLGLKKLGMSARGLLAEGAAEEEGSVNSEDDAVVVGKAGLLEGVRKQKPKRRGRESLSASKTLGKDELARQQKEILKDKENLHVRKRLVHSEIAEITHKIVTLDDIRARLEQDLLKLQEEELELDDELEGVRERLEFEQTTLHQAKQIDTDHLVVPTSSRRRKGPVFLPSEHDELPPSVAFMTLQSHITPITALDFSEPYGTLVTASQEDTQPRVWDLLTGTEIGRLRGHRGGIKAIQVEGHVCLTGAEDGSVRLWDLRKVDEEDPENAEVDSTDDGEIVNLSDVAEEDEEGISGNASTREQRQQDQGENVSARKSKRKNVRNGKVESDIELEINNKGPCARVLEGHTQTVTALFFEDECLVTGASDKTLRQWDLTTGQCVMTMDILWAISHPPPGLSDSLTLAPTAIGAEYEYFNMAASTATGHFSVPTPSYADGTWEMYQDFVGGVQFWGYGLVSGSGDGAIRMWDMRTGQAHRTLLGHTGPITCLQFDEINIVTGSLDKTFKIWDVRTGGISETIKFDHAVTALQFDSRKIVAAAGENGVKIYNRTTSQIATLLTNGHTKPAERLRYMDRYLVSGGRDSLVKVWSL